MLFIYLKRAALNTRGGRGIDWSTYSVSLNGISPGHNRVNLIENEREGDTCLFNLHQNPIKPRSPRYAKRETVDVILNNLSSRSLKIVHRDDRPNGSIVSAWRQEERWFLLFVTLAPESHHSPTGIELIAFLYFAFAARARGSMVRIKEEKSKLFCFILMRGRIDAERGTQVSFVRKK